MERMSRAGRMAYTVARMKRGMKGKNFGAFSKGEIARITGVKSSTWFRHLLLEMVDNDLLVRTTWWDDAAGYEMEAFYIAYWWQPELEAKSYITINGVHYNRTTGEEWSNVSV